MSNQWTKEQRLAIDTRGVNLLVSAAAGSGKTAVLVERIIQMITKDGVDIDALLVMTFTNAAAAEMRERIGEAIVEALEKEPENRQLERQLTLLNRSSITTIHSFCLEVIRSHFHEIQLDPGFRIADDTEGAILREEALEEVLETFYEEGSKEFLSLVDAYGGKKDDKALGDLVLDLHRFIMSHPWPLKWLEEKVALFRVEDQGLMDLPMMGAFKEELLSRVRPLVGSLSKAKELSEEDPSFVGYVETFLEDQQIVNSFVELLTRDSSFDELRDFLMQTSWSRMKSAKRGHDKNQAEVIKGLREDVKETFKGMKENYFNDSEEDHLTMLQEIYPHLQMLKELTSAFMAAYESRKREKSLLDFSDLEHLALRILTEEKEGQMVPSSIARGYKEKFEEVLVDEYQDSNEVQEVLITMVSRKEEADQNVFMVGDVKQSIYRFRQAKPALFMDKYRRYTEDGNGLGKKILLYKNFRSKENILNTVNFLFKGIMSDEVGELDYTDEEALIYGATYYDDVEEGEEKEPVEILLMEEQSTSEEEGDEGEMALDPSTYKAMEVEAKMVAGRIKDLINEEFMVYDKGLKGNRPVTYRDIVILMRATSSPAPIYLEALHEAGIPCYSDNSTGYFDTIEIRTVMSLLKIIDNPLQDVPLLAVLRSPLFAFSEEELVEIRKKSEDEDLYQNLLATSWENIALSRKIQYFLEKLKVYRDLSGFMNLDEFIWYLYTDTSYLDYVSAMPDGLERQANLKVLFQRAKQFEETSLKGLFNFIRFIDRLKKTTGDIGAAKILGENENLVRIMSIHKSKGLEFPVVLLVNTAKRFNKMDLRKTMILHEDLGFGPTYFDLRRNLKNTTIFRELIKERKTLENLSEEMRILYVALTRAKEKLIITGQVKSFEKSFKKWTELSAGEGEGLLPVKVEKASGYLDWIMAAFLKHHGLSAHRTDEMPYGIGQDTLVVLNKMTKLDVLKEAVVEGETKEGVFTLTDVKDPLASFMISERLGYVYDHEEATKKSSKISVTELKKLRAMGEDQEELEPLIKERPKERPRFLSKETGLQAAERGTAFHKVMQHISLFSGDVQEIEEDLHSLLHRELLTKEELQSINPKEIDVLLKSPLGHRMKEAEKNGQLHREKKFLLHFGDSEAMVIGVIDCFFQEGEDLIIVDYKTDRVSMKDASTVLTERYEEQLRYYEEALKAITGLNVKEKYLYSVANEKEIFIN